MRNFFIRLIINALALYITASLLPGISLSGEIGALLLVALIFGIVNAILKPILILLTCPAVIVTLGIFILVINGLLLQITSSLSNGALVVEDFGWAFLGGIAMGVVGVVVELGLSALGLSEDKK
jgi:putative membrane protein